MNDRRDCEPDEAAIDALLDEHFAGEAPPDLTARVAARRAHAAAAAAKLHRPRSPAPLLTAAFVLLGTVAVLGTYWLSRDAQPAPVAPRDEAAQDPKGGTTFRLKVLDHQGAPVQTCTYSLLYTFLDDDADLRAMGKYRDLPLRPRDFDAASGEATIPVFRAGRYALRIDDGLHAPTFSAPFDVDGKGAPIVLRLDFGGTVRGVVRNQNGDPVASAVVTTCDPERDAAPKELMEQLIPMPVRRCTERTMRTAADGSYELQKLTPGEYVVEARHDDYCVATSEAVTVPLAKDAGARGVDLRMFRGAVVCGKVDLGGHDYRTVRVDVEPGHTWHMSREDLGRGITVDENGRFEFAERMPPGPYTIMTSVLLPKLPGRSMHGLTSKRNIEIGPDDRRVEADLKLR